MKQLMKKKADYMDNIIPGPRTFVFDVDGTISSIKTADESYSGVKPFQDMIDSINHLYDRGNKIILFTARGMRTYNNDLELINKHVKPVLEEWLNRHNVQYHELIMGKPWGPNVTYVDDRGFQPEDFLEAFYIHEDI